MVEACDALIEQMDEHDLQGAIFIEGNGIYVSDVEAFGKLLLQAFKTDARLIQHALTAISSAGGMH